MTTTVPDVVDEISGASPAVAARRRPVTREQSQASFEALFSPLDERHLATRDRWLLAAFATRLTADDRTAGFYADRARIAAPTLAERVLAEAGAQSVAGPYGVYAEPGLRGEDIVGPRYAPSADLRAAVGEKLAAGLAHVHLLTYRLRETDGASHDALLDAGWNVDGIVTLSQLIAFLAFQQRVAAGLRVLSASEAGEAA
ncbi:CMD domain protein [Microbacterium sp. PA5]|uniref:CMD domain protein n=1 Tax=Microbacterium sp. PA5 TaxID=3416654 RepID=UPI003CF341E3